MNKKEWGEGPWVEEPDLLAGTDSATGYPWAIVRNDGGALCGYVGVSKGHPAYGMEYEEVPCDVHGGLTFKDELKVGEPGVRYFGFDCAHSGDYAPAYAARYCEPAHGTYRDLRYVVGQIKALAQQLSEVEPVSLALGHEEDEA